MPNKQELEPNQRIERINKMDAVTIDVAGAIYSLSDMIIFEVMRKFTGELSMRVIVQIEDVIEQIFTYDWDKIPSEVMELYSYTTTKSYFKNKVLFGTHLGRKEDRNYALMSFDRYPIGEYSIAMDSEKPSGPESYILEKDEGMFSRILKKLKHVKNI